jgi:hypothetical protein
MSGKQLHLVIVEAQQRTALVLDDAAGQSATRIKVQTGRRFDHLISKHILFCVQFCVRVSHGRNYLTTENSNSHFGHGNEPKRKTPD